MRSCCVFDSPRHPVFLPGHHLLLPRCGGQIPCALQLMRTLAPLPSTTLSHNLHPKIQINYIDTKNQLADILTKGNFTRDEWNHLLCLSNISHFSSTNCSEVMSKRTQKDSGEERVTAKSKPMMNLVSRCIERNPNVLQSTASVYCIRYPVKTRHESQLPLSPWTEQYLRTGTLVEDAYSSSYSEWNVDKNWSSQEWKSDELMEVRTGRHVLFAQHTDRLLRTMIWTLTPSKNQTCH